MYDLEGILGISTDAAQKPNKLAQIAFKYTLICVRAGIVVAPEGSPLLVASPLVLYSYSYS